MASGIEHANATRKIAKWNTVIAPVSVVAWGLPTIAAGGLVCGLWVGHWCTPDIDHHERTHEEQRIYRRFGCIIGALYQAYWWPYEKLHSHRSRSSHMPVVGTFRRFLYLLWLPIALSAVFVAPLAPWSVVTFWLFVFVGQCIQDTRHAQLDNWRFH